MSPVIEIKRFTVTGKILAGRRGIFVDGVQWATAVSHSQRGAWGVSDMNHTHVGYVVPSGKKSDQIDATLRDATHSYLLNGRLKPPPIKKLVKDVEREESAAKRVREREKMNEAAPAMLEALEFIMENGLLQGPYHLQDTAKRKARLAIEAARAV